MRHAIPHLLCMALLAGCGSGDATPTPGPTPDGGLADALPPEPSDPDCVQPEQRCGSRCVNTDTDPNNCGACGETCAAGAFCQMGECTRTCSSGFASCGSSCVDLATDPDHCGECGKACPDGRACEGGSCVCAEGLIPCEGECVDPSSDADHCGMCGRSCGDNEACMGSDCVQLRELDCTDGDDGDDDGLVDCEDAQDCEGTTRSCSAWEGCDDGVQTCQSDGTWSECTGCGPAPECSSNDPCAYGWYCSSGSCQWNPSTRWDVWILDGDVNSRTVDGGEWDGWPANPAPDPYVEVTAGSSNGAFGSTGNESNTYTPEWDERVLVSVPARDLRDYMRFEMRDSDGLGQTQRIGACVLRGLSDLAFEGASRLLTCPRNPDTDNAGFRVRMELREP